jgi:hypothetical protein
VDRWPGHRCRAALVAVVLPFLTDAEPSTKIATAALNLSIGATIGSLVSSIGRSAVRVVNA